MNNLLKLVIEKKIKLHTFHHILKLLITYSWLVCGTLYCIYVTNIYDKTILLLLLNPNSRMHNIKPMNNTIQWEKERQNIKSSHMANIAIFWNCFEYIITGQLTERFVWYIIVLLFSCTCKVFYYKKTRREL